MSNKGGGAASLKQGNLFSFFAKKKPSATAPAGGTSASASSAAKKEAAAAASSAGPSASSSSSSPTKGKASASANNNTDNAINSDSEVTASRSTNPRGAVSSKQAALLAKVHVGCTVAVYWPDDAEYYPAKVRRVALRCVALGRAGNVGSYLSALADASWTRESRRSKRGNVYSMFQCFLYAFSAHSFHDMPLLCGTGPFAVQHLFIYGMR